MSFDKELTHLVEQQIATRAGGGVGGGIEAYARSRRSASDSRIEALEANLQRLTEEFMKFVKAQKKAQKNAVEYGLEVIALHDFRLAVTGGRAVFIDLAEPIDLPFTYLHLSPSGSEREIRYIYLDRNGIISESTTDPSNMGPEYLALAVVDIWANSTEITQSRIKDIRPGTGNDGNIASGATSNQGQLVGNVTLDFPDTGNDSFIVAAVNPAGLKVNISAGRALVDGEIVDAPGGILDLSAHRLVEREFVGFGDGVKKKFSLYHKNAANVKVYLDEAAVNATIDAAAGTVSFASAPPAGASIRASYNFSGNYMMIFLVEKVVAEDGHSFGVVGWKVGSNRTAASPPDLPDYQHAIAKVDMSASITAITNALIDNSYEVKNLTQYELQYGGNLSEDSLQDGAVTTDKIAANSIVGNKIAANSITGDKIAANTITGNKIVAGTITGDKIIAGGIDSAHIKTGAITADRMAANSITIGKMDTATQNKINTANTDAAAALKNAATAQTTANTANNTASAAQTMANTANNTASAAQTMANTANYTATTAQSVAEAANSTASAANESMNGWKYSNTTFIDGGKIYTGSISADKIRAGTITADRFESTTWGDVSQALRFTKAILGGEQSWRKVLTQSDLNVGAKSQVSVTSESYPSIRLDAERRWDAGIKWDSGVWDIPVYSSGYWESASIDYGSKSMLQAEFWAKPIVDAAQVTITVKAKYSNDNVTFTSYENLMKQSATGYYYWTGTLQSFRFFKIRVEFATTDKNKYVLLGYPEARAANCQIGTKDISDYAVSKEKMAAGALGNNIAILSGTIAHGGTIPLPSGYTQAQCRWMIGIGLFGNWGGVGRDGIDYVNCTVNSNRVVSCYTENGPTFTGTANYIIIGLK